jgi:ribosomal-protein-alanine N-acetyltransferase
MNSEKTMPARKRIRKMHIDDLDDVYNIEIDSHNAPWSREVLRDCVLIGYDCLVIEIVNNNTSTIAGYLIARCTNKQYHILNLCVRSSLQQQGLGSALLKHLIITARKNRYIRELILEVRLSNDKAITLYEKHGFVTVGFKEQYYKNEDALVLKKITSPESAATSKNLI